MTERELAYLLVFLRECVFDTKDMRVKDGLDDKVKAERAQIAGWVKHANYAKSSYVIVSTPEQ